MSKDNVDSLAHGVAGGLGGLISMTLTYPLVTMSTKAQASKRKKRATATRKMTLDSVKNLYNGLESALVGITATNFVYYYFYEFTGSRLVRRNGETAQNVSSIKKGLSASQSILAGLVAGVVSRVVTNPIWIANTRLTVLKRSSSKKAGGVGSFTTAKVIYSIIRNEGWKNLFAGLLPALVLVLNPIIQYTIFEQLKTLIVTKRKRKLTPLDALFLGAFEKLIATIVTYPYITLRSRMHLQSIKESQAATAPASAESLDSSVSDSVRSLPENLENSEQLADLEKGPGAEAQPTGMVAMMVDIAKNEGVLNLYNGLSLKLLQSILSAAFLFYFKEELVLRTDGVIKRVRAQTTSKASHLL